METKQKRTIRQCWITAILSIFMIANMCIPTSFAEDSKTTVTGKLYEFDKDNNYKISEATEYKSTNENETYGTFSISGNISNITTKDNIPSYEISSGNLKLYYTYDDALLQADKSEWHLEDDKNKKIDGRKLDESIMKGTLILQISRDGQNWSDDTIITNAFHNTPIMTDSFYETSDVQLLSGCYYRLIVAYKLGKLNETSKFLFFDKEKYEYKKYAEVYEFYAYVPDENDVTTKEQTYNMGEKIRVKQDDGYWGEKEIEKSDMHYGWDLGNFFISGYTDKVKDNNENMVFLKNVGDKVTLWFRLNQNIDQLNGNKNLSITEDDKGYDQYFQTPRTNFGRGTLIIRYTDYNGNKSEPQIYTNYLEANTSIGADTKVQLFEEGDYEIALNYEITNDKLMDEVAHYRIFFKFSVRNGNCMVYPFDVATGDELTNSSMTENGFRLDLAKSRYLKINVKRETLTESADGLMEDTRFNGPAKDGAQYVDEGIYTITVNNEYTNQFTTKKIYVGTNNILKAHLITGLSIPEINERVLNGAEISDDGTISVGTSTQISNGVDNENNDDSENQTEEVEMSKEKEQQLLNIVAIVGIVIIFIIFCFLIFIKPKQKKRNLQRKREKMVKGGEK